ncbi:MAG: hypothetical protein IT324_27460 [Anaerolineae bacterium]|nr:hypothetical protein [Anaerolineae bacterium]
MTVPPITNDPPGEQPLGVFENIYTTPRRRVFRLLGVPVDFTPRAWVNPLLMLPLALVLTFVIEPSASWMQRIIYVALWVLIMQLTIWAHSIGHIISGKIAGSPMDSLLVTATRHVNIYEGDQRQYPPRVHILRAAGGGIANIAVSFIGLILIILFGARPTLLLLTVFNLVGFVAYLPIESVDGATIFRYWRAMREG